MSLSRRLGLRTIESQISAILFGSVLITLLTGVGVVLERDVAAAGSSAVDRATAEAQVLSQLAETALHTGQASSLDPILDRLGSREEIAYVRLVGPDGRPIVERIMGGGVVPLLPSQDGVAGQVRAASTSEVREITDISVPVFSTSSGAPPRRPTGAGGEGKEPLGWIQIGLFAPSVWARIGDLMPVVAPLTLSLVLVSLLLTRLMVHRITAPVRALTAAAVEGERDRCLKAGMDDFLPKPLAHEPLREILMRWTCGAEPTTGTQADGEGPAASGSREADSLRDEALRRLGDRSSREGDSLLVRAANAYLPEIESEFERVERALQNLLERETLHA